MCSDDIAIRVTNLSKRYEIYANPRDRLKQFVLPRLQRLPVAAFKPMGALRHCWNSAPASTTNLNLQL